MIDKLPNNQYLIYQSFITKLKMTSPCPERPPHYCGRVFEIQLSYQEIIEKLNEFLLSLEGVNFTYLEEKDFCGFYCKHVEISNSICTSKYYISIYFNNVENSHTVEINQYDRGINPYNSHFCESVLNGFIQLFNIDHRPFSSIRLPFSVILDDSLKIVPLNEGDFIRYLSYLRNLAFDIYEPNLLFVQILNNIDEKQFICSHQSIMIVVECLEHLLISEFIDLKEFTVFLIYRFCSMYFSYIKEFALHKGIIEKLMQLVVYYGDEESIIIHEYAELRRKSAKILCYISKTSPDVMIKFLNSEIMEKWINDITEISDPITLAFSESVVTLYRS